MDVSRFPGDQNGSFSTTSRFPGDQNCSFSSISRFPGDQISSFSSISRFSGDQNCLFSNLSWFSHYSISRIPGFQSEQISIILYSPGPQIPCLTNKYVMLCKKQYTSIEQHIQCILNPSLLSALAGPYGMFLAPAIPIRQFPCNLSTKTSRECTT